MAVNTYSIRNAPWFSARDAMSFNWCKWGGFAGADLIPAQFFDRAKRGLHCDCIWFNHYTYSGGPNEGESYFIIVMRFGISTGRYSGVNDVPNAAFRDNVKIKFSTADNATGVTLTPTSGAVGGQWAFFPDDQAAFQRFINTIARPVAGQFAPIGGHYLVRPVAGEALNIDFIHDDSPAPQPPAQDPPRIPAPPRTPTLTTPRVDEEIEVENLTPTFIGETECPVVSHYRSNFFLEFTGNPDARFKRTVRKVRDLKTNQLRTDIAGKVVQTNERYQYEDVCESYDLEDSGYTWFNANDALLQVNFGRLDVPAGKRMVINLEGIRNEIPFQLGPGDEGILAEGESHPRLKLVRLDENDAEQDFGDPFQVTQAGIADANGNFRQEHELTVDVNGLSWTGFVIVALDRQGVAQLNLSEACDSEIYRHPLNLQIDGISLHYEEIDGEDPPVRLIPFTFSQDQSYMILISPGWARVFYNQERVASIHLPYAEHDIREITWDQDLDTLFLFHSSHPTRALRREGVHNRWRLFTWPMNNLPAYPVPPPIERMEAEYLVSTVDELPGSPTDGFIYSLTSSWKDTTTNPATDYAAGLYKWDPVGAKWEKLEEAPRTKRETDGELHKRCQLLQAEGTKAIGEENGYPSAGIIWQGRLWVVGIRGLPQAVLASKVYDYQDFDICSPELDDSGIFVVAGTGQINRYQQIHGGDHIQVFGDLGEAYLPQPSQNPLTPQNTRIRNNSAHGAKIGTHVIDIGGSTAFIQRGGQAIRLMTFTEAAQKYEVRNLSLASDHLIRNPIDMAYQYQRKQSDTNLLLVVNEDGTVAVMSVELGENIEAWSLWETEGRVLDIAVENGRDIWQIARRGNRDHLEIYDERMTLDNGDYIEATDGNLIQRLDFPAWARNETVVVRLYKDGERIHQDELVVPANLKAPLNAQHYCDAWEFGERIDWVLETLPFVLEAPPYESGGLTGKRRYNEAVVFVLEPSEFMCNCNLEKPKVAGPHELHNLGDWDLDATIRMTGSDRIRISGLSYTITV